MHKLPGVVLPPFHDQIAAVAVQTQIVHGETHFGQIFQVIHSLKVSVETVEIT